jgi:transposase
MDAYPKAAMERAMKVQDVMLQAMAKKISWWQAAEILGITDRHLRRWRERYEAEGYNGLFDWRRGKPSSRRVPMATVEQVLALYREKYFDLNVQHFHEKLRAEHGIELSYSWVKQALRGAGLVARGRKRGAHRKRRERRPLPGMLPPIASTSVVQDLKSSSGKLLGGVPIFEKQIRMKNTELAI